MNSSEYWRKRESSKLKKGLKDVKKLDRELKKEYLKASEEIQSKIATLFMKYAKDNNLTYYEASKYLTSKEFKSWRMSLKAYIKEIEKTADTELLLELNSLAMKSRISRLEEMLYQINLEIDTATLMQHSKVTELLESTYRENYYKTIFDIQQFKRIGSSFAFIDKNIIENVLSYPWSGLNYSSRIWNNRKKLKETIKQELTQMIIQGKSNKEVAKRIAEKMDASYKNTIRLVDTEHAYMMGQATKRGYEETGLEQYQFLSTLDMRTSKLCKQLDMKIFKVGEEKVGVNYPPMHPNCRSTTIPYYDDIGSKESRVARNNKGKSYEIHNLSYKQWYEKYVN